METPVNEPRSSSLDLSTIDFTQYLENDRYPTGLHSGDTLRIRAHRQSVSIEGFPNNAVHMAAGVREDPWFAKDGKNRQLFWLTIRTIDPKTGEKHPDFHARELTTRAFDFLEHENGQIDGMQFWWVKPTKEKPQSTNYTRYKDTKQKLLAEDPEHDERRASILAAFHSWSGEHIAIPHNFKWIVFESNIDPNNSDPYANIQVSGTFYRDDPRTFLSEWRLESMLVGNIDEFANV